VSIGVILLGLAAAIGIAGLIMWPLRENQQEGQAGRDSAIALDEQLRQMIKAIHDLDFDFDTGKVTLADYNEQRKLFIGRGVSLLIRLDDALREQKTLDDEIEKRVNAFRQGVQ
jgi:hypothetical protein